MSLVAQSLCVAQASARPSRARRMSRRHQNRTWSPSWIAF